jgi:predicted phosphoribosyltransferase
VPDRRLHRDRRGQPGGEGGSDGPLSAPPSELITAEPNIFEAPGLRERVAVFRDRIHAGEILAGLLEEFRGGDAVVLAIPAGGYPVASEIAGLLGLSLDVAVVSKITPSWNTEVGYGAVAFDGTRRVNERLAFELGVDSEERRSGIETAWRKVTRRVALLRGDAPAPDVVGRPVILVDDGLASGTTMLVALEALEKLGAGPIAVAVPTGHLDAARRVAERAAAVYCANLRSGPRFAVASAYEHWHDVTDDEILRMRQARRV